MYSPDASKGNACRVWFRPSGGERCTCPEKWRPLLRIEFTPQPRKVSKQTGPANCGACSRLLSDLEDEDDEQDNHNDREQSAAAPGVGMALFAAGGETFDGVLDAVHRGNSFLPNSLSE